MSATTTVDFQVAARRPAPRSAQVFGVVAAQVLQFASAVLDAARRNAERRALDQIERLASRYEAVQPNLAAELRAAAGRHESDV